MHKDDFKFLAIPLGIITGTIIGCIFVAMIGSCSENPDSRQIVESQVIEKYSVPCGKNSVCYKVKFGYEGLTRNISTDSTYYGWTVGQKNLSYLCKRTKNNGIAEQWIAPAE